jgi:hypothetical protein
VLSMTMDLPLLSPPMIVLTTYSVGQIGLLNDLHLMTLNDVLVLVLADLVLLLLADLAMYNEEVIVVVDDSPSPSVPPSTTVSTIILMDEEDASLVAVNSLPVNHTIRYSIYTAWRVESR